LRKLKYLSIRKGNLPNFMIAIYSNTHHSHQAYKNAYRRTAIGDATYWHKIK